ncbi:MAG: hypothetical protein CL477_17195 [Acidobacteria bacterium]|jgi:hypothetical protein|nr:hypothetical protein [Acidobacteriota bacterium]MBQ02408.1 hypothetical protein [Acidobacteriota bacterium]MDP7480087.1 hypothetical protein [Vicinamibacterales bacterium]HJN43276.1 hypothetical protein [Vicinamibacterales bacterium]|tara:strand:- start:3917 stop:4882 length:966 start_codon:yes stop_codon:yes gene_type:complete
MKTGHVGALCVALLLAGVAQAPAIAQEGPTAAATWTPPRTEWGAPDLQGIWDYRTLTPLERPDQFDGREFLSDEEISSLEQQRRDRTDGRPPGDPRTAPSVHAPYWLDYGTTVVGSRRSSLIVDPPDGKIPPLSDEGERRAAERRNASGGRGSAESVEARNLWERCITRGLPNGMLPAGYNNNIHVLQTPHHVVILNEMIHDARIVPVGERTPLPDGVRQWRGHSRGYWDGDTLVVETSNFSASADFRGASENLQLEERFRRTGPDTLDYTFTVSDPTTWTAPWTATFPIERIDGPMYEYACHEGNLGLLNILTAARVNEK